MSPFVFDKRCNAIASKGIENAYDEALLEPYAITISDSDGEVLSREFNRSRKREFANYILTCAEVRHFRHFHDLRSLCCRPAPPGWLSRASPRSDNPRET